MTNLANLNTTQSLPVKNGVHPRECANTFPVSFDWTAGASYDVDLSLIKQQGRMSNVQSIFIDNSINTQAITVTASITGQAISIGAGWQGYFPIMVTDQVKLTIASGGSTSSIVHFLNFPLAAAIWPATAQPAGAIANPLPVTEANLDALIVSSRFNVRSIDAQATGTDRSGTITVGGTAQTLMIANTSRRGFLIQNVDSSLAAEEIWISLTGTAVIGGAGSFALSAYGAAGYPGGVIQGVTSNAISVIATTTGHKFTATEW